MTSSPLLGIQVISRGLNQKKKDKVSKKFIGKKRGKEISAKKLNSKSKVKTFLVLIYQIDLVLVQSGMGLRKHSSTTPPPPMSASALTENDHHHHHQNH